MPRAGEGRTDTTGGPPGGHGVSRPLGSTAQGQWGDWLPPVDAWQRVLAAWGPPPPLAAQEVGLTVALGRVLATDVRAPADSPLFDRSAVDGYAVRAADAATASSEAPTRLAYAGEVVMGAASTVTVGPGQTVWVATGAMIPTGADGVIMVERTACEAETVLLRQAVSAGDNVVRRGADLRAGDLVLRAGHTLRPQDVAVLASMGLAAVDVRPRPRVAIIAGGDELAPPGQPLGPGQIYDANSYAMAAQIEAWGGEPHILPRVPDQPDAVRAALREAVDESHLVLLSGGSSVGVKDLSAEAIDAVGQPGVVVHGVAMRPGRPTLVGVVDGVLVIGIPGNPVSAMVACEVFARPAVETLLGVVPARVAGVTGDGSVTGRLAARVPSQQGRQDYVRVRLIQEDRKDGDAGETGHARVAVEPVPGGSSVIRSMVDADGLLIVPPDRADLEVGETVDVHLF